MVKLDSLLKEVINDAVCIGFPVSENLARQIVVDKKRYDRVGACYRYTYPERYEIHLSDATQRANIKEIKNIIAHEVLHANFMTMEHNIIWKMYQKRMNETFGYNIQIKYSWHKILKR